MGVSQVYIFSCISKLQQCKKEIISGTDSYFQIVVGEVICSEWIVSSITIIYSIYIHLLFLQAFLTNWKMKDITDAVLHQLNASCSECSITNDIIDEQSFSPCFPESPSYVTYRARLEGTSKNDTDLLISLMEEWVNGGASINVIGVLMTVESECSVAISSLSEEVCSPTTNTTTTSDDSTIVAIIGGVVAAVVLTFVTVIVIAIVLILKSCRKVSINKTRA